MSEVEETDVQKSSTSLESPPYQGDAEREKTAKEANKSLSSAFDSLWQGKF